MFFVNSTPLSKSTIVNEREEAVDDDYDFNFFIELLTKYILYTTSALDKFNDFFLLLAQTRVLFSKMVEF